MTTYRIFPSTNGAATTTTYTGSFISAVNFQVTKSGIWFQGYWWWVGANQSTAPVKCALWHVGGYEGNPTPGANYVPNSAVTSGTLVAGWNFIPLPSPLMLSIGITYQAQIGVNGNFPDTNGFWAANPNGITNGPLFAYGLGGNQGGHIIYVAGGAGEPQGLPQSPFSSALGPDPQAALVGSMSNTDNFWVDVQVTDVAPAGYSGSYRIWPNTPGGADGLTSGDAAVAYVIGTEFHLSQTCTLNKVWYYTPAGTNQIIASNADIWSVDPDGTTGSKVIGNPSPVWSDVNNNQLTAPIASWPGGWMWTNMPATTLVPGKYKVSVYAANGATMSWGGKRVGYWGAAAGEAPLAVVAASDIVEGPITAPTTLNASTAFSYNPTTGNPTEPGQSVFAATGTDTYPNYYVGVNSTGGNLWQNYWVDVEVTPHVPAPVVTAIAPSQGMQAGGTAVTITGSGFTNATAVYFGANAATSVVVVSDTSITCVAPAGSVGTVDVTVTTPGGTSATSSADHFSYTSSVTPGFVDLAIEWLGEIHGFSAGELVHCTVRVLDIVTFNNAIDPQQVNLKYTIGTGTPVTLTWLYSNWDQVSIPFPAQGVGVLSRTNQGQFEAWIDTTAELGIWKIDAQTLGAGQGCSAPQQFYVTPIL